MSILAKAARASRESRPKGRDDEAVRAASARADAASYAVAETRESFGDTLAKLKSRCRALARVENRPEREKDRCIYKISSYTAMRLPHFEILIDSCVLGCAQLEQREAASEIIGLVDKGILVYVAQPTEDELEEIRHHQLPMWFEKRIKSLVVAAPECKTPKEIDMYAKVNQILALNGADANDIRILYAAVHDANYFVTLNTKHFMRNNVSQLIEDNFRLKIGLPSECLDFVQREVL